MTHLGVNIDHVATLRQQRGTSYPCPVEAARISEAAGAANITAHLREDRRHVQDADVYGIAETVGIPLNLEMANAPDILKIALEIKPGEACIVPERREELTTEGGLDALKFMAELRDPVAAMLEAGIAVSLFIEPDPKQVEAAAELSVPVVEFHTGTYCDDPSCRERELARLIAAAEQAHAAGIRVNAGHGITVDNVEGILTVPHLHTLNIGHSIISRAVFIGMHAAVVEMREALA